MDKQIYDLTEKIDNDLRQDSLSDSERKALAKDLKGLLPKGAIVLAQASSVLGDVKSNALKAFRWINWAERLGVEAIVFPETFLVGAPVGDFVNKFPIIIEECSDWLGILATKTQKTKVIIGFVELDSNSNSSKYYNSVAVLSDGKIQQIIRKSILFDTSYHCENRCFEKSDFDDSVRFLDINGKTTCVFVGDELFPQKCNSDCFVTSNCKFDEFLKDSQIDYLINSNAFVSRIGEIAKNYALMSEVSQKYSLPFVSVNYVGSTENLLWGGSSCVYNKNGELLYRAKAFEEQFFIVNPLEEVGKIYPVPENSTSVVLSKEFSLDYENDLERIYQTLVRAVRNYFEKTGFKRAVLGLSGGLDSTVSAVILADAIGAENVVGVSMPSKITSNESKNDARLLAENLGLNFFEMPVKDIFDTTRSVFDDIFSQVETKWECRYKQSFTNDNIQARSRALILWGIANEFESCIPIATSDKSELYMGYATINGDMSGGYAPLADVTKTKLFALAKWMNKNRPTKNAIPESVIEKRPGAELAINPLTGKPLLAEEALMPYDFMDEVIWRVENLHQSITEMEDIEFLYEKNMKNLGEPISKEQKKEWLQKFFRRMSFALFKWQLMPPSPIVDSSSINRIEYSQAVLSSGINYEKTPYSRKLELINQLY